MIRYDPNWNRPWWTKGAIDHVERFLENSSAPRVFEYGSGMSTKWLAERCTSLVSIENTKEWYDRVDGFICNLPHAKVRFLDGGAYTKAILGEEGMFDVVIIDGIHRRDCLSNGMKKLRTGGLLVVDDAQAEVYWGMQKLLAGWVRHSYNAVEGDKQHDGKVTMVYANSQL